MKNKFTWPSYPQTDEDFNALMQAIDAALDAEGLKPPARPLHVPHKLWEAFGWGGNVFPSKELANLPGFAGDVLIAKAHCWYEQLYADQLKTNFTYGCAPYQMRNHTWRVLARVVYGEILLFVDRNISNRGLNMSGDHRRPATFNVLCAIDGLTPRLAEQLSDRELVEFREFYVFLYENLHWRSYLPRTQLLEMAHGDYDASTSELIAGRYGQARWAAQQAIEKTFKGLLTLAGTPFPTGGAQGHDLDHLASLLASNHDLTIESSLLALAACSPKVRYNEVPSTSAQAIGANHAVLAVFDQLRSNQRTKTLLARPTTAKRSP